MNLVHLTGVSVRVSVQFVLYDRTIDKNIFPYSRELIRFS